MQDYYHAKVYVAKTLNDAVEVYDLLNNVNKEYVEKDIVHPNSCISIVHETVMIHNQSLERTIKVNPDYTIEEIDYETFKRELFKLIMLKD